MGADFSKENKIEIKPEKLLFYQLSPSNLTKLKTNFDKNPITTSFDKKKFISFLNCGKKETEIIFDYFDMDDNGVIDSYEFTCAIAMLCYSSKEIRSEFIFKLYDVDEDNYLSQDELGNFIRNYLISQKKPAMNIDVNKRVEIILKDADFDQDNKLSLKEFQVKDINLNKKIYKIY
jgi:Ca2+-binding EF-hand superfamily protein